MAEIEKFDENTQRSKVAAGFKGGPFYNNPMTMQKMNIADGIAPEVTAIQRGQKGYENGSVEAPWFGRRNK